MRLEIFEGFTLIDMIYDYASFEIERKYAGAGSFTLTLNSLEYAAVLQRDNYIVAGNDCYIIENIHKYKNDKKEMVLEITGRHLSSILDRRAVGGWTLNTGVTYETQVYNLINANFINPVDGDRKIPFLSNAPSKGLTVKPAMAQEFESANILGILEQIMPFAGLGFRINYNPEQGTMQFEIYRGTDRTESIFFSEAFGNLAESELYEQGRDYRNVGYLNTDGILTKTGTGTGIDRREFIQDGDDLADVAATLAGQRVLTSAECVIFPDGEFAYRQDWDLGDIVTFIDKDLGFTAEQRVLEIKETYAGGKADIDVTFGDRIPTVWDKLSTGKNSSGTEVSYSGHTHDDRYYTESEADTKLSGKVDKVSGKGLSTEDYTTTEKTKLSGIETGANKYIHPSTHPASMITESTTRRFVTDTEKTTWNDADSKKHTHSNKAIIDTITQALIAAWNGAVTHISDAVKHITAAERTAWNAKWVYNENTIKAVKVNNAVNADTVNGKTVAVDVPSGAKFTDTVYTHPASHPASIIAQDASNRFVTDTEKTAWNAKQSALSGDVTGHYHSADRAWTNITGKPGTFPPSSHTHDSLNVPDTRAVNDNPSGIPARTLSTAFKSNTSVDNPPVSTGSSYAHILTMNGWTGGNVGGGGETTQVAFGDSLAVRMSSGTSTWGMWKRLATVNDIPTQTSQLTNNSGFITSSASISGNAATATKLQTARTINGVAFDGTANITVADPTKEPAFTKNTAFNKNFGTTSGTVCQGNDARLSDARTPTTHTHTKSQITDMPTKLSQFQNDIGAGAGLNIVVSATEPPQLVAGDWWFKEV